MPRTRSKGTTGSKATPADEQQIDASTKKKPLESVDVPSRTFILPSKRSEDARFLTLESPNSGAPNRYFFDSHNGGLYEFTSVASTPWAPRSILLTPKHGEEEESGKESKAYVTKKAELLIATPIDVLFFMLPIIAPEENTSSTKNMFQPLDDILDSQDELAPHLRHILYDVTFRPTLERRMQAICDTMEAGDETLYRFKEKKLVNELIAKAERMIAQGLPTSLEERFVRTVLDPPLTNIKKEEVKTDVSTTANEEGQESEISETQSTTTTTVTVTSEEQSGAATPATQLSTVEDISSSDAITRLLRLRIALSFMKQSYLPPHLSSSIDELLKSPESPIDFKPLDDRLKELAILRAEANASVQVGNYTRKRGYDDEDGESQAEKRRKKEEEEKKKKLAESRGVRDLKKVNTSGMKKMSDFFKKKT
ncbi:uncharacterized protein TRUGW13939_04378 [Talaromyces rugulosus]|uniref:Ribonuclease H2 subunit B n=1 Tax=Talaromyces rugulosus TaxID=121627 RepID=A0A7H8QTJ8_TALRU|nr:uncharacterized protein TRUGW13939_04378 [Talaromyces rugulosus]QKX57269.1 hypothetical protein TRUGW13939_04378 [Talaromyces rugulosus]